jgi:hypothetical protein
MREANSLPYNEETLYIQTDGYNFANGARSNPTSRKTKGISRMGYALVGFIIGEI